MPGSDGPFRHFPTGYLQENPDEKAGLSCEYPKEGFYLRKKQAWIAAFLAIGLLIIAGCGKSPDSIKDNIVVPTAPATEPRNKVPI